MKARSILKEILGTSLYLLALLALAYLARNYVGQRTHVTGSSMEATLTDGDQLIVDKLTYRFQDPQRFDIIVFPVQTQSDAYYYIKRVIGLPGETVRIDSEGTIYIDEEQLTENYGREVMLTSGRVENAITLGEDEYFVLGDNRNNSSDSRDPSVGNIKRENIVGRAFIRIWPFESFGILRHQ